jgi:hypothetical protein
MVVGDLIGLLALCSMRCGSDRAYRDTQWHARQVLRLAWGFAFSTALAGFWNEIWGRMAYQGYDPASRDSVCVE